MEYFYENRFLAADYFLESSIVAIEQSPKYASDWLFPLREKFPNTEFFWSVFSCIQSEYRKIRTRKNSVYGHFSHSAEAKSSSKAVLRRCSVKKVFLKLSQNSQENACVVPNKVAGLQQHLFREHLRRLLLYLYRITQETVAWKSSFLEQVSFCLSYPIFAKNKLIINSIVRKLVHAKIQQNWMKKRCKFSSFYFW